MEFCIDKIFDYLNWNNSEEIQRQGIELASKIKHLSVLFMPIENKSIWKNCAKVLVSKSDDELQMFFCKLFEWLKDMNWPGADLVFDRLLLASAEYLVPAYKHSVLIAKQTKDYAWEMALTDFFAEYSSCRPNINFDI